MKSMLPVGTAASIASIVCSNRTPKFGSCQPTRGRFILVRRKRRSVLELRRIERLVVGTVESMQNVQVYGQPRLASIGTSLIIGAFCERLVDELPAIGEARQVLRLRLGGEAASERTVGRALVQHRAQDLLVREAQDVVEVLLRILGIAARVRTAEHRDGAALLEHVRQRVRDLRALRERADEQQVEILREFRGEVFETGVARRR